MSNYYIVVPTSGFYAQALGGSSAMSGIVIGCTPVMASISAYFTRPGRIEAFEIPFSSALL